MKKPHSNMDQSILFHQPPDRGTIPGRVWLLALLVTLLSSGCASPFGQTSRLMLSAPDHVSAPPAGQSLVIIDRPRARQGYPLYTGVWDSTNFIADLGNGHSCAYVCEPGTHYFINRSVERVGVVEARLLPDRTYAVWLDTAGAFIASFQLEAVTRGSDAWKKTSAWEQDDQWVARGSAAAGYEQEKQSEIHLILHDFVGGSKQDRLRHLGPDDCR